MKTLLTTATTILFLLGGAGLAQAQEHDHSHEDKPHAATKNGGMSPLMMAQCRMTMDAELSPSDPTVLLGMKGSLALTDEQIEQLQTLAQEARRAAAAVLTEAQRQQVAQLPQQPQSMMQMHRQMMGRMKDMGGGMGQKEGMDMCAMMMRMMAPATQPATQTELDAKAQAALNQIVTSYLTVQQRLAADEIEGVADKLSELHDAAHALMRSRAPGVREKARAVAGTVHDMPTNLDEARKVFKALSAAMLELVKLTSPSDAAAPSLYEAHCPMAEASWLQIGQELVNPYMGPGMLRCGTVEQTLKPGGQD